MLLLLHKNISEFCNFSNKLFDLFVGSSKTLFLLVKTVFIMKNNVYVQ